MNWLGKEFKTNLETNMKHRNIYFILFIDFL